MDERFVVGGKVGDVLRIEKRLLIEQARAGELLAGGQRGVVVEVLAQIRQEDLVAADGGAAVVVGGDGDSVERMLALDHREPFVQCARVALFIAPVVRLQRREDQGVVGDRRLVVSLGRVPAGGAA